MTTARRSPRTSTADIEYRCIGVISPRTGLPLNEEEAAEFTRRVSEQAALAYLKELERSEGQS